MPTWREYIVGEVRGKSNWRTYRDGFEVTHYAQSWQSLLNCARLHSLARYHGYRLVFFPHVNITPYLNRLSFAPGVETLTHRDGSIQEILAAATVLVTDYSSVAFDAALLQRAILYYQFDKCEFLSGDHLYSKAYFEYEHDGFGPCCVNQSQLLDELSKILQNDGLPEPQYLARMQQFFPFHDDGNCERVFKIMLGLLAESERPRPQGKLMWGNSGSAT